MKVLDNQNYLLKSKPRFRLMIMQMSNSWLLISFENCPLDTKLAMSANHGAFKLWIANNILSRNSSQIGSSFSSPSFSSSNFTRWSATTFSDPFLSLISISNSYKSITYHMSLSFESFLFKRYFNTAWFVYTITLEPSN